MKRRLLLLTCAALLAMATPCAASPAQKPQGYGSSEHKHHWFSFHWPHREKHSPGHRDPLHKSPKSVGWWHHSPGPAGHGAR